MQWKVTSKKRLTYRLLLLVQSGKQSRTRGHAACLVFHCIIPLFLQTRVRSLLCCVWTSIMPLSVCVFLNAIRSAVSCAVGESVMYRTCFLDFNAFTLSCHSSTLAWKIPWTEDPGGLQSMGSLRVGHNWVASLSLFTFMHRSRKWQPTPVFLPWESQGRRSLVGCCLWGCTEKTWLKRLSSSSTSFEAHSPKAPPPHHLAQFPAEATSAYACQHLPAS